MFLLITVPISQEFGVPLTEVAFLLSVTLWLRLVGAVGSDWLADRIGRKTPLMISILWYSICNFIAGISPAFWFLFFVPGAARHRHGRRMAGRRGSRDGILAGALPRVHERPAAGLVEPRVPLGQPGLWVGL